MPYFAKYSNGTLCRWIHVALCRLVAHYFALQSAYVAKANSTGAKYDTGGGYESRHRRPFSRSSFLADAP